MTEDPDPPLRRPAMMQARLLGWAGVQLRDGDASIVIDPLQDAGAMWAPAGDAARDVRLPDVVATGPPGAATVALVTHLHRDHADADALHAALHPDGHVLLPEPFGGDEVEEAGIAAAGAEIADAALRTRHVRAWERVELHGWTITALPAVDGTGDPQVSWLVERSGTAVVHGGDTLMHGWWWRAARRAGAPIATAFLPVNAALVRFPHRQPASPRRAVMDARDAAAAAAALGAASLVPIHYGAFDLPPVYVSDPDPIPALRSAARAAGVEVRLPELGRWFDIATEAAL